MSPIELALEAGPWLPPALIGATAVVALVLAILGDRIRAARLFRPVSELAKATATSALPSGPSEDVVLAGRLDHEEAGGVRALGTDRPCAITTALARVGDGVIVANRAATGLCLVLDDGSKIPLVGSTEAAWSMSEHVHAPLLRGATRARVEAAMASDAPPFERVPVTLRSISRGARVRVRGRLCLSEGVAGYRGAPAYVLRARTVDRAIPIAPRIRAPRPYLLAIAIAAVLPPLGVYGVTLGAAQVALAEEQLDYWDQPAPYTPGVIEAVGLASPLRERVRLTVESRLAASLRTAAVVRAARPFAHHQGCAAELDFLLSRGLDEEVISLAPSCESVDTAAVEITALRRIARLDEAAVRARREGTRLGALIAVRTLLEAGDREGARELAHARRSEDPIVACVADSLAGSAAAICGLGSTDPLQAATAEPRIQEMAASMRGLGDVLLGHPLPCDALCRAALAASSRVMPSVLDDDELDDGELDDTDDHPFARAPRAVLIATRVRELLLQERIDAARRLAATEPLLGVEASLAIEAFAGSGDRVAELLPGAGLDARTRARLAGLAMARLGGSLDTLAASLNDYPPPPPFSRGCMVGSWLYHAAPDSREALLASGDRHDGWAVARSLDTDGPTIALVLAARAVRVGRVELLEHLHHDVDDLSGEESIATLYGRALVLRATAVALGDDVWRDSLDLRLAIWSEVLDDAEDAAILRALDEVLDPAPSDLVEGGLGPY